MAFTKHTLFMIRGTGSRGWQQLTGGQAIETAGHYENGVGRQLDHNVWDTVDVRYPGDTLTIDSFIRMGQTADDGFDILKDLIRKLPPGRKFALAGTSQGAIVTSRIYEEIRSGTLSDRDPDLLAAVAFGNPRRYPGWSIPGGTAPGGLNSRGALGDDIMTQPDSRWWDFVMTGDIVADTAFNTSTGQAQELIFEFMQGDYTGVVDFVDEIVDQFNGGFFAGISLGLEDIAGLALTMFRSFLMAAAVPLAQDPVLNNSPHIQYHWPYTNLPGNTTASAVDLAVSYLTEVGYAASPGSRPKPKPLTKTELLKRDLLFGDSITSSTAAEKLAEENSAVDQTWHVSVHDKMWVKIGELGDDMISLQGKDPRNKMPAAQLKIKGESQLIDAFMNCSSTHVGVIVETAGIRFPFYVDTFDYEFDNGAWVGTANLNGIWDILNYLVIWPNWWLPIQFQLFSHAVFIGPLCTAVESMISENALRIQSGLWEFVNNAASLSLDVRAWFGTLLQSNGNIFDMLKTPIYVVRTNPFLDTSPLIARTVRMETCGAVIEDITRSYGVNVNVDLWLPGDDQPDYWTQTFPALALTQPTYVVSVKDRSQITGPTGTVIDSAIRQVVDVSGTFFEGILPFIQKVPGRDGVFISPSVGVDYVEPWAVLIAPEPGQKGNVLTCRISFHTPKGWQHIIGGRSPKWLNDLMNATYAWIIDSISILLGFTGIPSNLLEGFLNNTILAFQMVQHYDRRDEVGPYHPGVEVFHATTSAPYNVETLFGFINALWESRGWVSVIATFRNAEVYTLGKDVFRGGLVSVLYMDRTRIFTDYIEEVTFQIDRNKRDILLQIGDGKAEESPLAKHQRFITGVLESINVLTLAPQN